MTPGPKTTGRPLSTRARSSERSPPTPASACASSWRTSTISASSRSPTSAAADERQPVAARAVDEVIGAVAGERLQQRTAVRAERAGLEHLLDDGLAILQYAQVERDGAGVDAGYPGHIIGP